MSFSDDSDDSDFDIHELELPEVEDNSSPAPVGHEQWVKSIEYSSYRCGYQDAVPRGSGVERLCRPIAVNPTDQDPTDHGWILTNDHRQEQLIVSFETAVFINEIHVYESLHLGCVVKLEMLESERNKWWTLWQRKSISDNKAPAKSVFKPLLRRYHLRSKTIRLTIDPRSIDRLSIHAIKVVGSTAFDSTFHQTTLLQAMAKLYQQTRDHRNGDVQFLVDGQLISAHRNILCSRSHYFHTLLLGDFSERTRNQPIELTDVDFSTLTEVLHFFYTGVYRQKLDYAMSVKCMLYCNKINFLSGKNAALEQLCRLVTTDHDLILSIYCLAKQMSPALDLLLDYIYDLSSKHMNEICKQQQFGELGKELMIDLICQSAERHDRRAQEQIGRAQ